MASMFFRVSVKNLLISASVSLLVCELVTRCFGLSGTVRGVEHTPAEVLLVYNANSPVSTAVARYYAAKRGVTKMVAVHCADSAVSTANETILLADYTREIGEPVSRYLARHAEINFIVLTKGVPIRVRGAETGSRDENRPGPLNASVDSFLAAMDYPTAKVDGKDAVKISIHGSG